MTSSGEFILVHLAIHAEYEGQLSKRKFRQNQLSTRLF